MLVIALTQSNVKDRARLANEFSLRTAVSGRLVESYLSSQQALMVARAEDLLSGPTITPENLKLALSGLGYQAGGALDGRGRALITQPYSAAVIGQDYSTQPEDTRIAVQQDRPGVSQALIVVVLGAQPPRSPISSATSATSAARTSMLSGRSAGSEPRSVASSGSDTLPSGPPSHT